MHFSLVQMCYFRILKGCPFLPIRETYFRDPTLMFTIKGKKALNAKLLPPTTTENTIITFRVS